MSVAGTATAQTVITGGDHETVYGDHSGTRASPWDTGDLRVGDTGAGALTIGAGGVVRSGVVDVGIGTGGAHGVVTVTGAGTVWETERLTVAHTGTGTLMISDGGRVSSAFSRLGSGLGSTPLVFVEGAGSRWDITGSLGVGYAGDNATLTVRDGGTVTVGTRAAVYGASTATVTGVGSRLEVGGQLEVGRTATHNGTLTIEAGGTVTSAYTTIAPLNAGTGTLNLNGTAGARGALETGHIEKGDGGAVFTFDGGILRATRDEADFLRNFTPGEVTVGAGGAFLDTNGFDIGIGATLGGPGSLTKLGAGTLLITGDNSGFTGATTVAGGTLVVGNASGGALGGPVQVLSGAALGGSGTVGATTIAAGAVHAPGNSIGVQTIAGDYANHGTLRIEATPASADRVVVDGAVDITGATLDLVLSPASPSGWDLLNGPFTIIDNRGGAAITGTFDPVTTNLLFLEVVLDYAGGDGNDLTLALARNSVGFAEIAHTGNQAATAGALESLGAGNALYDAVAAATDAALARRAFDQLSGEIHASAGSALLEESRFVRDAIGDRLRAAFGGVAPARMSAPAADGSPSGAAGAVVWGTAFGASGAIDGDGNAAGSDTSVRGVLTGIDGPIPGDWRFGLLAGYSRSGFDAAGRASTGRSDNLHLGAYAGTRRGPVGVRSGVAYTRHEVETTRSVAVAGTGDRLSGDYGADTVQVFAETGYRIDISAASFEPSAGIAYVGLHRGGFAEEGGAASLSGRSESTEAAFTTLGLRAATGVPLGAMNASARGMLGWRHAIGDVTPSSTHAFAGGDAFTVSGVPFARDAAVIEAGLDLDLTDAATIGLSYQGQFGSDVRSNGLAARLRVAF